MHTDSRSQSEVIGVVLLIGVVVSLTFLVSGVVISTYISDTETPRVTIDAEATTQNITVYQTGGDNLDSEEIEIILEGDRRERYQLTDFTQLRGSDNTTFARGDEWERPHGIDADRMEVLAIHQPTNTVLDRETIDVVETLAVRLDVNATDVRVGETIQFDGSNSTDPGGSITGYEWDFDDGTTAGEPIVNRSYSQSGTYTVSLTVTTDDGRNATQTREITVSPIANFTVTPSTPFEGNDVTFDASSSDAGDRTIEDYQWEFGDGTTASGENVTHNYSASGTYLVSLTINDSNSEATAETVIEVRREVANLQLDVAPETAGADAVHNWTFDDVDFGSNGNGDEVDTITVDYSGTNASFDGLDETNITVVLTRELNSGEDTSEISVNMDDYSGEGATFDLSESYETSIVGAGYVRIDGLTNPPGGGAYDAEITFDGDDTVSATRSFGITGTGDTLTLIPENGTIAPQDGNNVTVTASDGAGNPLNESVDVAVGEGNGTFGNGNQTITVETGSDGNATVRYTANGSDANETVRIDGVFAADSTVSNSTTFDVSPGPGTFGGFVEDDDGTPLPVTNVTFTAGDGSFNRTVETNASGGYTVGDIPANTYNITATATGRQSDTVQDVTIDVNRTTTGVNVTLVDGVENLSLDVTPTTTGSDAVHNWTFDAADFECDDETDCVDRVVLEYNASVGVDESNLDFSASGVDENTDDIIVHFADATTNPIGVTQDSTFEDGKIVLDLNDGFNTPPGSGGYIEINGSEGGLTNPSAPGTYDANITFVGGDGAATDSATGDTQFTIVEGAVEGESVTDIVPDANEQDQTVAFTLVGALAAGDSVEINLTDAQGSGVDYLGNATAFVVNSNETAGQANITEVNGETFVTYTPQSGDDDDGTRVTLRVRGINASSSPGEYNVTFDRTDSPVQSGGDTFETARGSGDAGLSVAVENITVSDAAHNVTLTPDAGNTFEDGERIAIELADPHGDDGTAPPKVQYQGASVVGGTTNGEIVSFNEIDNGETAYVIYEAPAQNASDLSAVTVSLDIDSAALGGTPRADFDVGVSRATADTAGATFELAGPAFFKVNITAAPASVTAGEQVAVEYTVENTGGVEGNQTLAFAVNGAEQAQSENITLAGGDSENGSFTYETTGADVPEIEVSVSSEDTFATETVQVDPRISIVNAQPGATTSEVRFDIENNHAETVTVEAIALDDTSSAATRVNNGGNDELSFSDGGRLDAGGGNIGIDIDGSTYLLDVDEAVPGGERTTGLLAEFEDASGPGSGGNSVDMTGETVTVTVSLTNGETYSETLTVEPRPYFTVEITNTNSPVNESGELTVDYNVTNVGSVSGEQDVTLSFDGSTVSTDAISLPSGGSQEGTLTYDLDDQEPDEYDIALSTDNSTDTGTVDVISGDEPFFDVVITDSPAEVTEDENLTVTAEITNAGTTAGTQNVTLAVSDGVGEVDSEEVQLSGGENTTVSLTWVLEEGDAGKYKVTVGSEDDEESVPVTVGEGVSGQVLQPVEILLDNNDLQFTIENTGEETVTVEKFAVNATAVGTGITVDNGNANEIELTGTSQNGFAGRNGNPGSFSADGTIYDFVVDSNANTGGQYADIAPGDGEITVDLREFSQRLDSGASGLQFTDSPSDADVVVTLILSDGTSQRFYFEQV